MDKVKKYIKGHFEANMLDGDDVKDCGKAMMSAEYVLEYIQEYYVPKSMALELVEVCDSCWGGEIPVSFHPGREHEMGMMNCPKCAGRGIVLREGGK